MRVQFTDTAQSSRLSVLSVHSIHLSMPSPHPHVSIISRVCVSNSLIPLTSHPSVLPVHSIHLSMPSPHPHVSFTSPICVSNSLIPLNRRTVCPASLFHPFVHAVSPSACLDHQSRMRFQFTDTAQSTHPSVLPVHSIHLSMPSPHLHVLITSPVCVSNSLIPHNRRIRLSCQFIPSICPCRLPIRSSFHPFVHAVSPSACLDHQPRMRFQFTDTAQSLRLSVLSVHSIHLSMPSPHPHVSITSPVCVSNSLIPLNRRIRLSCQFIPSICPSVSPSACLVTTPTQHNPNPPPHTTTTPPPTHTHPTQPTTHPPTPPPPPHPPTTPTQHIPPIVASVCPTFHPFVRPPPPTHHPTQTQPPTPPPTPPPPPHHTHHPNQFTHFASPLVCLPCPLAVRLSQLTVLSKQSEPFRRKDFIFNYRYLSLNV
ncbi:hypothetical protein J6590_046367 [Homalodisca vitripennis]|nr:hypothetical protein J6590_046367 [Homalodisca vitripennis]